MNAIAYIYKCADCDKEFEAPETPELSYGLFVMRVKGSIEAAFLDATNDFAFLESLEIVKRHPLVKVLGSEIRGKVQQAIFSVTCDTTPNGKQFEIGIPPTCPSCGGQRMQSWCPIVPDRSWPLPIVGHVSWESKSATERELAIDSAIRRFLAARPKC
jgi:DNA-directed RNA polymerase subunit RPC12/RpoP